MIVELYVLKLIIFDLKFLNFLENHFFFPVRRVLYVYSKCELYLNKMRPAMFCVTALDYETYFKMSKTKGHAISILYFK